jgi:P-type conjugative transfer protein TrbJ
MTRRRLRAALLAGAACVALSFPVAPLRADLIVFDPNNYVQNVLTAARELQQINNEIQSLENEAQMLINQARNLASLPYSALAQLRAQIQRTEQLLQQAQRIAYSVTAINQAFTTTYRQSYPLSTSAQQLVTDAQTRWQNALAGFQDAMTVQAGAVQNLDTTRTQITALVSNSQSATGALQALQSGNQLVALQTNQLADVTAVLAALARAQSLEGARTIANQEQAQVQLSQFLNYGAGYQPQTVQMFH